MTGKIASRKLSELTTSYRLREVNQLIGIILTFHSGVIPPAW